MQPKLARGRSGVRFGYSLRRRPKLVYVDDANVLKYGRGWFHLTADGMDELHAFAAGIGVPVRAFHRGARHPHYDITAHQRQIALRRGAHPVCSRELVRVARRLFVPPTAVCTSVSDAQLTLFV